MKKPAATGTCTIRSKRPTSPTQTDADVGQPTTSAANNPLPESAPDSSTHPAVTDDGPTDELQRGEDYRYGSLVLFSLFVPP